MRLCGKWLQENGFHYGQSVLVCHKKNKIIITLNKEMNSDQ
ncbi:hypothetical protein [Chryseobacterium sp.]